MSEFKTTLHNLLGKKRKQPEGKTVAFAHPTPDTSPEKKQSFSALLGDEVVEPGRDYHSEDMDLDNIDDHIDKHDGARKRHPYLKCNRQLSQLFNKLSTRPASPAEGVMPIHDVTNVLHVDKKQKRHQ